METLILTVDYLIHQCIAQGHVKALDNSIFCVRCAGAGMGVGAWGARHGGKRSVCDVGATSLCQHPCALLSMPAWHLRMLGDSGRARGRNALA